MRNNLPNLSSNLFAEKMKAALQLLSNHSRGGILHLNDSIPSPNGGTQSILETLKKKQTSSHPANPNSIFQTTDENSSFYPVIFESITAATIQSEAKRTNRAADPSGIDAQNWRRLCTSFKSASIDLCGSLALLARRLCRIC